MSANNEFKLRNIKSLPKIAVLLQRIFAKFYFRKFSTVGHLPPPNHHGLIVVSNHPSNAATALLIGTLFGAAGQIDDIDLRKERYPRALADSRIFTGIRGVIFRAAGQIPVDRSRGADAYKQAEEILNRGGLIMIYPEGTRTKQPNAWPTPIPPNHEITVKDKPKTPDKFYGTGHYKTGAVRLAIATGATIVPTLQYLDRAGRGANAMIQFDQPISFADMKGKEMSQEELRKQTGQIMHQIAEMMAEKKAAKLPAEIREKILAG